MVKPKSPHRLLVEGKDDLYTVVHLTERHGTDWDHPATWTPYIDDCGGAPELLKAVGIAAKTYSRLGIVIDADENAANTLSEVVNRLKNVGVECSSRLSPEGIVIPGFKNSSRIGIWVMPDNQLRGALEDFLHALIPPGDACWTYAGSAAAEARGHGARYAELDALKARLYTWLAWQEEPGRPFGTAVKARYFDTDRELGQRFFTWFKRVFDPNADFSSYNAST